MTILILISKIIKIMFNKDLVIPFCLLIVTLMFIKISFQETTNSTEITFDRYLRYHEMYQYLHEIAVQHKNIVKMECFGYSREKRPLCMVKITFGERDNKPAILIEAGVHAKEWLAPAEAIYIINQLVEDPFNRPLISGIQWLIIPLLNPDGYEYAHTVDRKWRKNRKKGKICDGVDLNRNFDFHWSQEGSSTDECSDVYAGKKAFSEPESKAFKQVMQKYANCIKLYLSLHTSGQCIAYPWSYTSDLPQNEPELRSLAMLVASRLFWATKAHYKFGPSARILRVASGASRDWVYAVHNVTLAFTFELQPYRKRESNSQQEMPIQTLSEVLKGIFVGIKTFYNVIKFRYLQKF